MRTLGNFGKFRHIYVQICSADINIENVFFATKPFHFYSLHIITWQRQSQPFCDFFTQNTNQVLTCKTRLSTLLGFFIAPKAIRSTPCTGLPFPGIVHQTPSDIPNIKWVGATGGWNCPHFDLRWRFSPNEG